MPKWLPALVMVFATTQAVAESVLVFGGTGRLGAPIVRVLADEGHVVTVFARETSNRQRLDGLDVAYVIGDLMDADSVATALAGKRFDVVVDATSRGASRLPFYGTAMRHMLSALGDAGVTQFILHGSVGAGTNRENFPDIDWERMRDVMDAKGEAEQLLIDSGIDYTIIRNAIVRADGTPATNNAYLTEDQKSMTPVTRLDLASLTQQCFAKAACLNTIYHAADDSLTGH